MRIDRKALETGPLFLTASIDDESISDDVERRVNFVASDETVDRYGDVVKSDWQLGPFKKNPVLLWNHDRSVPPIGTVRPVEVVDRRLMVTANFVERGVSEFADQLWRLVKAKILRAVSVGFTVEPDDVELLRNGEEWTGGYQYNRPELLELSLCSVPANPNALAVARSLGVSQTAISRVLVPDALVDQQRHKIFRELVGARVRLANITSPR